MITSPRLSLVSIADLEVVASSDTSKPGQTQVIEVSIVNKKSQARVKAFVCTNGSIQERTVASKSPAQGRTLAVDKNFIITVRDHAVLKISPGPKITNTSASAFPSFLGLARFLMNRLSACGMKISVLSTSEITSTLQSYIHEDRSLRARWIVPLFKTLLAKLELLLVFAVCAMVCYQQHDSIAFHALTIVVSTRRRFGTPEEHKTEYNRTLRCACNRRTPNHTPVLLSTLLHLFRQHVRLTRPPRILPPSPK
jgi:hypothetical protein